MVAILFVFAVAIVAQNVEELQKVLKATNATWTAKESWVTRMSPIEQESLLGLLPGIMGDIPASLPENMSYSEVVALPSSYQCKVTSVKDQGGCGSCYAFGACATYESGTSYDLSEQDFMMKAKAIGPYGGCQGWYLNTSMNLLRDKGVTGESCCGYKGAEGACSTGCAATYKIKSYAVVPESAADPINTIKSNLIAYGPGYVGFAVYRDFFGYEGGIYRYNNLDSFAGYHAVAIVGYDDAKQAFKVKNSWKPTWGEAGYFWIGYEQRYNVVNFGKCFGGVYFIDGK